MIVGPFLRLIEIAQFLIIYTYIFIIYIDINVCYAFYGERVRIY